MLLKGNSAKERKLLNSPQKKNPNNNLQNRLYTSHREFCLGLQTLNKIWIGKPKYIYQEIISIVLNIFLLLKNWNLHCIYNKVVYS